MTPGRQLVYDYLSLPHNVQRRIAIDLQLLGKNEVEFGGLDMNVIIFRRAAADNKLDALREKVKEENIK